GSGKGWERAGGIGWGGRGRSKGRGLGRLGLFWGGCPLVYVPQRDRGLDRRSRFERQCRNVLLLELSRGEREQDESDVDDLIDYAVIGIREIAERTAVERLHLQRSL